MIWLFSLLLIYPFLLLITSPLKRLSLQMAKTGEGDFTTRIHEGGSREICELSNSLSLSSKVCKLILFFYGGQKLTSIFTLVEWQFFAIAISFI